MGSDSGNNDDRRWSLGHEAGERRSEGTVGEREAREATILTVTIYTKPGCPYCAAAKEDLQRRGVGYEEVDVYVTPGARDTIALLTGGRQLVPVLVDERGEVHIGFGGG